MSLTREGPSASAKGEAVMVGDDVPTRMPSGSLAEIGLVINRKIKARFAHPVKRDGNQDINDFS